ncbi:MAG TPA: thiamine pyrophosphate-dependent dehydrogenase E1 component subunit alpha [Anaerolineales bacterium]|nr:thiamine pyrophosphate-dependent dehydrogenase E1 component subunit alpha [Anaerolineales bacterium]
MPLSPEQLQDAYRQMLVIRKFEETIRSLYQAGKIRGSFHPCVGQEATAVGGCWALRKDDYMTCTYRGHGQAIAKGLSVRAAMAEMLGKVTGCSKGKGGSMHFTDPSVGLLGANAIVAAGIPHAAGAALASQLQKKDTVALTYFGEGAVNQGVYLETLNLAVVWKLPLILFCENNLYSEMTPSHETTSVVETYKRAAAFGFDAIQIDGNDIELVYNTVEQAVAKARAGDGPVYIEAMTYRLWGHMMGDPEVYRTKEEVAKARENEPIIRLRRRLMELGCSESDLTGFDHEAEAVVADALQFAEASPIPQLADAFTDVFI